VIRELGEPTIPWMTTPRNALHATHQALLELAAAKGLTRPVLGAPARTPDLAGVEKQLGALPPLVRELLLIANGWTNLPVTEPPISWFSCRDLLDDAYAAFVAKVRGTRGMARAREVQKGFIMGGNDNHAIVIAPDPEPQIVIYRLKPRTRLFWGPPVHFFQVWTNWAAAEMASVANEPKPAADPLTRVDEAIEAFNDPNEMGDEVHDSVEQLSEIVAELPPSSPFLPALRRLLTELERGYAGEMRFGAARRRGQHIEVELDSTWTPIDKVPA